MDFAEKQQVGASRSRPKRSALLIVVVLLGGAGIAVWLATRAPSSPDQPTPAMALKLPEEPSIAVLPFTHLSSKPEDEWFTDGMSETLITDLSRLNNLFVIARNSTFTYTREDMARAQVLFQQSLDLDPNFTMGMLYLGWTHFNQGEAGWSPDPRESYLKALELGRKAAAIDPSLGDAYKLLSGVLLALEKHVEAVAAADKALALSPNQADILAWNGTRAYCLPRPSEEQEPVSTTVDHADGRGLGPT